MVEIPSAPNAPKVEAPKQQPKPEAIPSSSSSPTSERPPGLLGRIFGRNKNVAAPVEPAAISSDERAEVFQDMAAGKLEISKPETQLESPATLTEQPRSIENAVQPPTESPLEAARPLAPAAEPAVEPATPPTDQQSEATAAPLEQQDEVKTPATESEAVPEDPMGKVAFDIVDSLMSNITAEDMRTGEAARKVTAALQEKGILLGDDNKNVAENLLIASSFQAALADAEVGGLLGNGSTYKVRMESPAIRTWDAVSDVVKSHLERDRISIINTDRTVHDVIRINGLSAMTSEFSQVKKAANNDVEEGILDDLGERGIELTPEQYKTIRIQETAHDLRGKIEHNPGQWLRQEVAPTAYTQMISPGMRYNIRT